MAMLLLLACSATYRLGQDALDGPAEVNSVLEPTSLDAHSFGPFGNAKAFAVECQYPLRTTVASLFLASSPAAIARCVVSVVVLALDLVGLRRAFAHVVQKRLKGCSPSSADRYTAASVPWIANVAGRLTAANHRSPTLVRDRFCHSMRCTSLNSGITSEASATAFCAFLQAVPICKCFTSALTHALPNKQSVVVSASERHDCQPAELLADSNLTCVISERPLRAFGRINNWLDILRHDFLPLVNGSIELLYPLTARESI